MCYPIRAQKNLISSDRCYDNTLEAKYEMHMAQGYLRRFQLTNRPSDRQMAPLRVGNQTSQVNESVFAWGVTLLQILEVE
jgi:hypothetical protein